MEDLIKILSQNRFAALAFGALMAFYIAGEIEERTSIEKPVSIATDGMNVDEEIAFHEARLRVLKLLKEEDLTMDQLVLKMQATIDDLSSQLEAHNA